MYNSKKAAIILLVVFCAIGILSGFMFQIVTIDGYKETSNYNFSLMGCFVGSGIGLSFVLWFALEVLNKLHIANTQRSQQNEFTKFQENQKIVSSINNATHIFGLNSAGLKEPVSLLFSKNAALFMMDTVVKIPTVDVESIYYYTDTDVANILLRGENGGKQNTKRQTLLNVSKAMQKSNIHFNDNVANQNLVIILYKKRDVFDKSFVVLSTSEDVLQSVNLMNASLKEKWVSAL